MCRGQTRQSAQDMQWPLAGTHKKWHVLLTEQYEAKRYSCATEKESSTTSRRG